MAAKIQTIYWPAHKTSALTALASSEDLDKPAHMSSLAEPLLLAYTKYGSRRFGQKNRPLT